MSLKEARDQAFANRKFARSGGDPLAEKVRANGIPTFAAAAERVWNDKHPGWRHPQHAQDWMSSLTRHVLPHIGTMPVCDVNSADVLQTLRRIWHVRPETARRVRQRIGAVMDWAIAMQLRTDNPCDRLGKVLGPQQDLVQHMRALPHAEVAAAIRTVWASGATPAVKLAFEFLVLTAARSGEVRGARWAEIDLRVGVWTIPATRMKAKREHRVPLCGRAVEMLRAARTLGDGCGPLVFPSTGRNPISITRLPRLLQNHKIAAVPHGFRSSFRDWGRRGNEPPARGRRSGPGARGREPDRGGVCAVGLVRAPPPADGRLGRLSQWTARVGDPATPVTAHPFALVASQRRMSRRAATIIGVDQPSE